MLEQPITRSLAEETADSCDLQLLAQLAPADPLPARAQPEHSDLELPGWIWGTMAACYALFFGGLLAGTGHDGEALFAIVISIGYAVMYFGTASLLVGQRPARRKSAFARGIGPLQTWTGPMDRTAVAAQILTVPACLAFFGIAIAIITRFAI